MKKNNINVGIVLNTRVPIKNNYSSFKIDSIKFRQISYKNFLFNFDMIRNEIYKEFVLFLKVFHIDFASKLSKNITKFFNYPVSVKYIKIQSQLLFEYLKNINLDLSINSIKIKEFKNVFYVMFSKKLILFSIESIFSNSNYLDLNYVEKLKKKSIEIYINKKLVSIIKDIYYYIWNKESIFNTINYFNDIKDILLNNFYSLHEFFIIVFFKIMIDIYEEDLILCIPITMVSFIRENILKKFFLKIPFNNLSQKALQSSNIIFSSTINSLQLTLVAILKEFELPLITLLNFKIGDVWNIDAQILLKLK